MRMWVGKINAQQFTPNKGEASVADGAGNVDRLLRMELAEIEITNNKPVHHGPACYLCATPRTPPNISPIGLGVLRLDLCHPQCNRDRPTR